MKVITWQDYDLGGRRVPSQPKEEFYSLSCTGPVRYNFYGLIEESRPQADELAEVEVTIYCRYAIALEELDALFIRLAEKHGLPRFIVTTFDRRAVNGSQPLFTMNNSYSLSAPRSKLQSFADACQAMFKAYIKANRLPKKPTFPIEPTLLFRVDGQITVEC